MLHHPQGQLAVSERKTLEFFGNFTQDAVKPDLDTPEAIFSNIDIPNVPPITLDEIRILQSLRWNDGTSVISLNNRQLMYELFFIIRKPYLQDAGYKMSDKKLTLTEIKDELTNMFSSLDPKFFPGSNAILNTFVFFTEKFELLVETDRLRQATNIVTGRFPCPNCSSYNTLSTTLQIRRADEPPTTFAKCLACSESWKE